MKTSRTAALAFAALACAHCGDDGGPTPFPTTDASTDVSEDAADGVGDTGGDVGDTDMEVGPDAGDVGLDGDTGGEDVDATDADAAEDADVDVGPTSVTIGGEMIDTGMAVGLRLVVDGEAAEEIIADPGVPYAFTTPVDVGVPFAVEVSAQPEFLYCEPQPSAETADVGVTVDVRCVAGRPIDTSRWRAIEGTSRGDLQRVELTDDRIRLYIYESNGAGLDDVLFTQDDLGGEGYIYDLSRSGGTDHVTNLLHVGDDGEPWTDDDVVIGYQRYEYEIRNSISLSLVVDGPGVDGTWYTDDDNVNGGSERSVLVEGLGEDGTLECRTEFTPGPDQRFETEDDVLETIWWRSSEWVEELDAYPLAWTQAANPGADGEPCTNDDVSVDVTFSRLASLDGTRQYTLDGRVYVEDIFTEPSLLERSTTYRPTGETLLGPAADPVDGYVVFQTTPFGDRRRLEAEGPGRDLIWFTNDDAFTEAADYVERDPYTGEKLLEVVYETDSDTVQGPDGIWGTRDDDAIVWRNATRSEDLSCWVVQSDRGGDRVWDVTDCGNGATNDTIDWVRWVAFEEGREAQGCTSTGAGPDDQWATADDEVGTIRTCSLYEWVSDTHVVLHALRSTGDDALLFTDDDTYGTHALREYDDAGNLVMTATAVDPGDDGVWFTGDDGIFEGYERHEFNALGRPVATTLYFPGDDGLWFTEDDVVGGRDEVATAPSLAFARL